MGSGESLGGVGIDVPRRPTEREEIADELPFTRQAATY